MPRLTYREKLRHLPSILAERMVALRNWYVAAIHRKKLEEEGLQLHSTALICGDTSQGRLKLNGPAWIGAWSMLWLGEDARGGGGAAAMHLGKNVYIGDHCNLRAAGGALTIGDNVLIANHVSIVTTNHGMKPGEPMIDQPWATEPAGVQIGSDVWIGAHVTLLPGTRIEDGAVIAAGAVVRGVVPAQEIWGGVPARRISQRS